MPELPEVETVRRGLNGCVTGRRFANVRVLERRLREPIAVKALAENLPGKRILAVERRAKYLLLKLEGGADLIIHLGMTGRVLLRPAGAPPEPHVHVIFSFADGGELHFQDPRRFGLIALAAANGKAPHRALRGLGLEPLARECTGARLHDLARGLRRPVKTFLMDGRFVVGVGNIYASEALFLAGIRPRRSVRRLRAEDWERVAAAVKRVLRDAIRAGGTTLRDFQDMNGDAGSFQVRLRVYDRAGAPCRHCGEAIRRAVLGGRSSYYCPACQR
jgi:formamidopyrimidine-DNA glycosylase